MYLGKLEEGDNDDYTLTIGNHILVGRKIALKKPYILCSKCKRSDNENENQNNSNNSKNDDSSENLDELIDFKLGDEICPEPEDEKYNDLNDNNDKEKEDNFEMTMKKKIMERTVERPTLGVPPPGTDPNDNFDFDDDDDLNNGVFQTNKNNIFNNDDTNFEI